jgi:hypothetical protein
MGKAWHYALGQSPERLGGGYRVPPSANGSSFMAYDGESPQQVAAFIEQTGVTFPIIEGRGTLGLFEFPVGVGYPYPRDVIVGKDLVVRSIRNSFSVEETDTLIQQLLNE